MLLAGGDLIESFGQPSLWDPMDVRQEEGGEGGGGCYAVSKDPNLITILTMQLEHILHYYGCVIIERTGTDVYGFLLAHDLLYKHRVRRRRLSGLVK